MFEADIERTARELRAEAEIDFFDVSLIAEPLRERLGLRTQEEIRHYTLDVIARLMTLDVYPGDYTLDDLASGRGFQFRFGTPEELLFWIEAEWIAMGHTPTLEHPICWFALRLPEIRRYIHLSPDLSISCIARSAEPLVMTRSMPWR